MKKILSITLIILSLLCSYNQTYAAEKKITKLFKAKTEKTESVSKTEKATFSNIYSVAKFFKEYEYAANNYNHYELIKCFSSDYLNADGFTLDILSKNIQSTWKTYPGIKYKVKLTDVTFHKNIAVANVTETATGYTRTDNENVAEFVSKMQTIYYLKPYNKSWLITGDYTTKENIILAWGDGKNAKMQLDVPNQLQAGKEYSAILTVKQPDGTIAIGSITADKITYPQVPSKEIFRKFSSEGTLERIMRANTSDTNEYIIGTVGFTKPKVDDNKNLDIKLTGYACLMERVNVIPVNKYIEVKNDTKSE